MKLSIDLNCDLGESFGAWTMGADDAVIPLVSSINVACGFHAGDPQTMLHTLQKAKQFGVAVGAHAGLPDLRGFGRREIAITATELYADTLYQLGALSALAQSLELTVAHIKAHGALYHMLERQPALAESFLRAAHDFSPSLVVVGLAQGELLRAAAIAGQNVRHEMFADRRYQANGTLVPRSAPNAVIHDPELAAAQVLSVLREGKLHSFDGSEVVIAADTVCIHGDRDGAAEFTQRLVGALRTSGVNIGRQA